MSSYHTKYKVLNEEGKVLVNYENHPHSCFATYSRDEIVFGRNVIHIYIPKDYKGCYPNITLTSKQLHLHVLRLNRVFPAKFTEEASRYVITLRECEYFNKGHVRTALDFFRVMWESGHRNILATIYKFNQDLVDKIDYFFLVQVVVVMVGTGGGHSLPCYGSGHVNKFQLIREEEYLNHLYQNCSGFPNDHAHGSLTIFTEYAKKKYAEFSKEERGAQSIVDRDDVMKVRGMKFQTRKDYEEALQIFNPKTKAALKKYKAARNYGKEDVMK